MKKKILRGFAALLAAILVIGLVNNDLAIRAFAEELADVSANEIIVDETEVISEEEVDEAEEAAEIEETAEAEVNEEAEAEEAEAIIEGVAVDEISDDGAAIASYRVKWHIDGVLKSEAKRS